MILEVLKYGHPVLRKRGVAITNITPDIEKLIADMFETMYATHGLGLAAQQVGHAVQLAVFDIRGLDDRPSTLEIDGKPADVDAFMPLALLNPIISSPGRMDKGPEGCLSFPDIYGDVIRPDLVEISGMNGKGHAIKFRCTGLLSRAIQHEADHLNGILFIDRMDAMSREDARDDLDRLLAETKAALKKK